MTTPAPNQPRGRVTHVRERQGDLERLGVEDVRDDEGGQDGFLAVRHVGDDDLLDGAYN